MRQNNIVGKKIQRIRESKNMSLREFAGLVDISHTHIARVEKSRHGSDPMKGSIQIDDLKQICDKTDYSFRQFLEEAGYIEPVALESQQLSELQELVAQLGPAGTEEVTKLVKMILGEINVKK